MSDFSNLPANNPNTKPPVSVESVISVSDIKDFISPKLYGELSWDENRTADEVTKDCIERAKVLTESMLHIAGVELNLFSKTQQAVVKTLTVYELYTYNGDRYKANAYMEKAEKLISDRYGSLEKLRENTTPVISLSKPKKEKTTGLWV